MLQNALPKSKKSCRQMFGLNILGKLKSKKRGIFLIQGLVGSKKKIC
jgi:hypothetical protein